jgi:site-specific DNA-cytosine methylase
VVVDLFGGIGAGVICLKRLKIAIKTVIHVEHDKVANHVFKYWHANNSNKDDGINHVAIPTFEEFEERLDDLLKEYGRKCFALELPVFS